jgi:hypothetical protein
VTPPPPLPGGRAAGDLRGASFDAGESHSPTLGSNADRVLAASTRATARPRRADRAVTRAGQAAEPEVLVPPVEPEPDEPPDVDGADEGVEVDGAAVPDDSDDVAEESDDVEPPPGTVDDEPERLSVR